MLALNSVSESAVSMKSLPNVVTMLFKIYDDVFVLDQALVDNIKKNACFPDRVLLVARVKSHSKKGVPATELS